MKKIFFIACLLLTCLGCAPSKEPVTTTKKPLLLVSVPPYESIVQHIAGETFEVATVVPPSADPHTYEPTARGVAAIAEGQLWFQIGEPFEQKLLPLLPKVQPFDLREGLPMIESHGASCHCHDAASNMDRHIWLSPKMVAQQIDAIVRTLSEQYPEKQEEFTIRGKELQEKLAALNLDIEHRLQKTTARSFLISHPAFAYFCRDYGCHQLSVEQEGKEPRPKELETLLASALESGARIAIAVPQHNNKGAQLIAEKLNIPVRVIDPYANNCMETMRMLAGFLEDPYAQNN